MAATGVAAAIAAALEGMPAEAAVAAAVGFNTDELVATLRSLYGQAADELGDEAVTDGPRLSQLLDDAAIAIKGMTQTAQDRIATAVADGVNAGESAREIAARVRTQMTDVYPGQAGTIAETEANRAYGASYIDTAASNGVEQLEWVRGDEDYPCDICESNEADGPYDIDSFPEFPAHPNCECTPESVVS